MAGFTGEPEQFAKAHMDVTTCASDMATNIGQLRNNIEATQAGWQGPAAALFQQLMERFDEKTNKINTALDEIGELLKQSGVQYEGKDSDIGETMKKLVAEADSSGGLGV